MVIGIGGSYSCPPSSTLIQSPNYNLKKKNTPDIFFSRAIPQPPMRCWRCWGWWATGISP